jgi:pilus assembly protein CpaF
MPAARDLHMRVQLPDGTVDERLLAPANSIVVGRDPSCDVVLSSRAVSRKHFTLRHHDEHWHLHDTSANGTFVNGERIVNDTVQLSPRCTLQVGPFHIELAHTSHPHATHRPAEIARSAARPDSPAATPAGRLDEIAVLRKRIHRMLLDQLDLVKLDRGNLATPDMRAEVEQGLQHVFQQLDFEIPPSLDRGALLVEMCDEVLGLGPLERLLADDAVSEIMVVDPYTIYIERAGRIELSGLRFTDDESVRAVIERIVTPLGRRIDESSPIVDARLKDGSRVNAVIRPLALRGSCITIRKFAATPLQLDGLIAYGSLTDRMATFLKRSVIAKKNIVISGGTGSGKTTLLNVLSTAIPSHERVVTIEDAAELRLQQPHVVSLETRPPNMEGRGAYTIRDLVRNALRMRPDRIVVGECRGGEALDMLQAMNTGHDGSMTTTHANSPREALARLETLCLMSGLDLPSRAIREQIASSVHIIIQQTRFSDGSRRVTSISEVVGIEDGHIEIREIFGFHRTGTTPDGRVAGEFRATGYLPTFLDEFVAKGLVESGVYL